MRQELLTVLAVAHLYQRDACPAAKATLGVEQACSCTRKAAFLHLESIIKFVI